MEEGEIQKRERFLLIPGRFLSEPFPCILYLPSMFPPLRLEQPALPLALRGGHSLDPLHAEGGARRFESLYWGGTRRSDLDRLHPNEDRTVRLNWRPTARLEVGD